MIFIETERLILRNVKAEDAAIMYDYRNNEICAKYQRGQTKDLDGIVQLLQRRKEDVMGVDAPFMVAVALKDTDEMVGELQIDDLFSTKDYADMSFEDMLLDEVITYAREHELTSISYIVGPEPFNPAPHLTQEQVIQWYLAQGFEQKPGALGSIKMVYQIPPIA